MTAVLEFLKAVLFGIVEGITEWLPVSSTGHLILLQEWLPFAFTKDSILLEEFGEMFDVVIQLGAILAVVVLFWHKLWPFSAQKSKVEKRDTWTLWLKVLIASLPAAAMGVVGDKVIEKLTGKDIDGWLYNAVVVSVALIVYGIAFIVIEKLHKPQQIRVDSVADITYKDAFFVGLFQMLSMVPGTSRSGSTILGSMLMGLSRPAAAEFSFFMAIPVMVGASGIKILGFFSFLGETGTSVPMIAWGILAVACVVSFAVSMVAIRFLTDFVKRHSFAPFGVYRILLGIFVILYFLLIK